MHAAAFARSNSARASRRCRLPDMDAINAIGRVILLSEASAVFGDRLGDRESFGADVFALLEQGRLIAATDYVNAQRLRRLKREEFRSVWHVVDFLVTPTTPMTAPRIGESYGGVRRRSRRRPARCDAPGARHQRARAAGYLDSLRNRLGAPCRSACRSSRRSLRRPVCCAWPRPSSRRSAAPN